MFSLFFFLQEKHFEKNFSRWMSANCAESANKRREFWRETHTPLWPLIGRIIFLISEKTSFAILIGRIVYFTCESHCSLFWLARTHLRMKSYDIAFRWVFLSMYTIGEGKRQNEFAEWHVPWLAEWHNYAECKIWKMAQRNKLNWKACARLCRAFFLAPIWVSNFFAGPLITAGSNQQGRA